MYTCVNSNRVEELLIEERVRDAADVRIVSMFLDISI
jgi:hypothetical protein